MVISALERLLFSASLSVASRLLLFKHRHRLPVAVSPVPTPSCLPIGHRKISVSYLIHPAPAPAVLIFHGIGETVATWSAVQTLLYQRGISSLVFDYAGYGRSSGPIRLRCFPEDAAAALNHLRSLVPAGSPISYLGLSLGTGVAVALAQAEPPHRLILCAPYTSFRNAVLQAARLASVPGIIARLFPDVWKNCEILHHLDLPTLLVHGEADQLFPLQMSESLLAACPNGRLIQVPALPHDCELQAPLLDYWQPIIAFLHEPPAGRPPGAEEL